jgi:N-acetylmuramoyl-L-alanine amidase
MKKILSLFFSVVVFFFSVFTCESADKSLSSQKVNAVLDGKPFKGINAYKVADNTYYFSIKEFAALYNIILDWKPISSKVTMHLNNKKIDVKANSCEVVFNKKPKKMSLPSRQINGDIYIPPEFFNLKEFKEITDAQTSWNSSSLVLTITHHANISTIKYSTNPQSTTICVQTKKHLHYKVLKRENIITLTILKGKIQKGSINVENGVIKDIHYGMEGGSAVVKINLEQSPKDITTRSTSQPTEILVDIEHSRKAFIIGSKEVGVCDVKESKVSSGENVDDLDLTSPEKFGQSQVKEFDRLDENDEENKDLKDVPVTTFESEKIIDDSFIIANDTGSIAGVVPLKKTKKKNCAHKKIIVIDAGHGGEDSGAVGANGTKEKDLNLAIVYELKSIFDKDDDFEVILTRKDDTFISLAERTNIANENNADLFISIHCNANFDRNVSGFEIYFLSEKATDSEAAATAVLENSVLKLEGKPSKKRAMLQEMLWSMTMNEYMNESSELSAFISSQASGRLEIPNKGVKQASFYVLRGSQMPAVLIESAFLSNSSEEAKLGTKNFRKSVANAIYKGVIIYYEKKERDKNSKKK